MIHVSAPGKMMLSGEWSVLELGNACVVAAVNRHVHVEVQEFFPAEPTSVEMSFALDDFGIKERNAKFDGKSLIFTPELSEEEKQKFKFIKEAIETALRYLKEKNVSLKSSAVRTWGEETQIDVDGQKKKVGFGSSAAAVVAAIASMFELHGLHIDKNRDLIFKLGIISHYFTQGKVGSGFDVAASTYGGIFSYIAPDLKRFVEQIQKNAIKQVAESRWSLLHVQPLGILDGLALVVGWTKSSADTPTMIKAMQVWKENNSTAYGASMEAVSEAVDQLLVAWRMKDHERILNALRRNVTCLRELTRISGISIETEDLRKLSDLSEQAGAVGKLSGAGGGDCGIAVCFDDAQAEIIRGSWKEAGIVPLNVGLERDGVKVVKRALESVGGANATVP